MSQKEKAGLQTGQKVIRTRIVALARSAFKRCAIPLVLWGLIPAQVAAWAIRRASTGGE